MEIIVYIIAGIVIGAVFGVLMTKGQKSTLEARCNALSDEIGQMKAGLESLKNDLSVVSNEKQELSIKYEVLATQKEHIESKAIEEAEKAKQERQQLEQSYASNLNETKNALEEAHRRELDIIRAHNAELLSSKDAEHKSVLEAQEKRHNEAVQSLRDTFDETIKNLQANMKSATEDMLKLRQKEFADINKSNMQGIVDPLNETIAKMKLAIEGYTKEQNEFSGSMKTNLETIIQQTETARQSAVELTTALKHDTKMQGDYGEAILDEILSKQGFTEGIHYELQYVMKDEAGKELKGDDGKGLRPDVLFHLDTVRNVIIDSKINLTDFINFANAETPEDRRLYLERHVKSIEKQVQLLSSKEYCKYLKSNNSRMDYVIMFVPISAAWWEALRYKPSLWREAMDSNVYIADEQTLFAALRIIKLTWTQIAQVDSQKEIFDLADEMVKRVGMFMDSYVEMGKALKSVNKAYVEGQKKLDPKGQSILKTAGKLLEKGAKEDKNYKISRFLDVDDVAELPAPELPSEDEIQNTDEND